jgi:hypothetical protein
MQRKFLALLLIFGLGGLCAVNAQDTSPTVSPSPAKHRSHKKAAATSAASPAAETTASPTEKKKRGRKAKTTAEMSPSPAAEATAAAAASPVEKKKRGRKKAEATPVAAASPAMTPAASRHTNPFGNILNQKPAAAPPAAPAATVAAAETMNEVAARATPEPGGGHGLVWVNTESHIYHKEGSRYYGKTKKGKYMTEAEAIKEGDKEAKREEKAKPQ